MEQFKFQEPYCLAPGYIAVSKENIPVDDLIVPPTESRYIISEVTPYEIVALQYSDLSMDFEKETGVFIDVTEGEDCAIEAKDVPALKRVAARLLSESQDEVERTALTKVIKAAEEAERLATPILFLF